jgi:hypothetical protein
VQNIAANGIMLQGNKRQTNKQTQGREGWAPDQPRGPGGGRTGPSPREGLDDQSGHSGQGNTAEAKQTTNSRASRDKRERGTKDMIRDSPK